MYRAYYQLQKSVNRKSISVGELFISDSLREAQARLDYMKDKGGFVLISGAPGVGKTTLVRSFAESLDAKFFKIAYAPLSTPLCISHRILPSTIFLINWRYTSPKGLALSYHPGNHHGNGRQSKNNSHHYIG